MRWLSVALGLGFCGTALAEPQSLGAEDDGYNPYFEDLFDARAHGEAPAFVVNGESTTDHEQVVALAVEMYGGWEVFCSGTLIHERWVLTAAHCLDDVETYFGPLSSLYIVFGGAVSSDGGTDAIGWADFEMNPAYNAAAFANDIGLVKLASPKLDVDVMVVNDEMPDESWVGTELTFVGFGITSDMANDAGTKRKTRIAVQDSDDQYIYSYDPSTNVCNGDSGGAALEKTPDGWEVAGVNAYVEGGCVGGGTGSTNVAAFLDFVTEHVPVLTEPPRDIAVGEGDFGLGVARDLDATYPVWSDRSGSGASVGCSAAPSAPTGAWLVVVGLLGLRRRQVCANSGQRSAR